ncbi:hypothetical protein HK097_008981 [Rhizophlyctis rosea]|uniref:Uncharacterized protein n=1 Tax=Rhizophlyctis rosea TaxID=64517 RepID=A0AAD5S9I8_9FUNG|nr:hypothetical protein HK097_008981 [Rhizophlyctis rosea]
MATSAQVPAQGVLLQKFTEIALKDVKSTFKKIRERGSALTAKAFRSELNCNNEDLRSVRQWNDEIVGETFSLQEDFKKTQMALCLAIAMLKGKDVKDVEEQYNHDLEKVAISEKIVNHWKKDANTICHEYVEDTGLDEWLSDVEELDNRYTDNELHSKPEE